MPLDTAVRQAAIGGSEIAAILGVDEWRDAYSLWRQKRGELRPEPPTPRMLLGQAFEHGILAYYSLITGRSLEFNNKTLRHPTRPWMVYTPDALCIHEARGVDAKLVSWDQRFKWGATADEIPAYIQAQAWWYMSATDYPVWDIAAVTSSGDPLFYTVERDLRVEAVMLAAAEEYYTRYLIGDETPPVGGSLETTRYLREAFPRHHGDKPRAATAAEIVFLEQYAQVRIEAKAKAFEQREFENRLKAAVADGVGLEWARGVFTWKTTKDSQPVAWRDLAAALMKGYSAEERAALEQQYTSTKAGVRRIHFRYDGAEEES